MVGHPVAPECIDVPRSGTVLLLLRVEQLGDPDLPDQVSIPCDLEPPARHGVGFRCGLDLTGQECELRRLEVDILIEFPSLPVVLETSSVEGRGRAFDGRAVSSSSEQRHTEADVEPLLVE